MPPAPQSLAHRFALIIEALRHAVARRGGRSGLPGPLLILIWARLRRMTARFTRLAERGPAPSCKVAPRPSAAREPRPRAPLQLPRNFASLLRLVPETAQFTGQLRHLLADPEMTALLAANPGLGRILRPLCHMLGIQPTPALSPATKPPAPQSAPMAEAPPPIPPPAMPPPVLPLSLSLNAV